MSAIKKLKRISVKELLGFKRGDDGAAEIKKLLANGVEKIFRIKGSVTATTSKTTQYGESYALLGDFIAQNLLTGEIFESSKAYLPKSFTDDIVGAFKSRGDASSGVEFTAEVAIMTDTASGTGYSYDVTPIQTAEHQQWKAKAVMEFAALPAPEVKRLKAAK